MVSIDDLLFEQTVLIPDPAAVSWKPYRGKGVEKTGSKATETAISKAGIVLYFPDLLEIVSQFPYRLFHYVQYLQVNQVIAQCPSHQKLHRKVEYFLFGIGMMHLSGVDPLFHDKISDHHGGGFVESTLGSVFQGTPKHSFQFIF